MKNTKSAGISFDDWLKLLDGELYRLGFGDGVVYETGSDSWIELYEDDCTPYEAAAEGMRND